MKCPKCGYASFNYLDTCKKCGRDLTAFKAEYNLWGIKPGTLNLHASIRQAVEREEPRPEPSVLDEELPGLEDGLPHEIEIEIEEEGTGIAMPPGASSQAPQEADLGGIHLDLGEIDLGEGEITLALPEKEEEAAIELEEELDLEEGAIGGSKPGEPPEAVPLIDLDLEEIDLGGVGLEEEEPVLELEGKEEEEDSDLLNLDEIELSWEEEEEGDLGEKRDRNDGGV